MTSSVKPPTRSLSPASTSRTLPSHRASIVSRSSSPVRRRCSDTPVARMTRSTGTRPTRSSSPPAWSESVCVTSNGVQVHDVVSRERLKDGVVWPRVHEKRPGPVLHEDGVALPDVEHDDARGSEQAPREIGGHARDRAAGQRHSGRSSAGARPHQVEEGAASGEPHGAGDAAHGDGHRCVWDGRGAALVSLQVHHARQSHGTRATLAAPGTRALRGTHHQPHQEQRAHQRTHEDAGEG